MNDLAIEKLMKLIERIDALVSLLDGQIAAARSPWMTREETCLYLRWINPDGSPDTKAFYRLRRRYQLPATKIAGVLRCRKDRIDAWINGIGTIAEVESLRKRIATR